MQNEEINKRIKKIANTMSEAAMKNPHIQEALDINQIFVMDNIYGTLMKTPAQQAVDDINKNFYKNVFENLEVNSLVSGILRTTDFSDVDRIDISSLENLLSAVSTTLNKEEQESLFPLASENETSTPEFNTKIHNTIPWRFVLPKNSKTASFEEIQEYIKKAPKKELLQNIFSQKVGIKSFKEPKIEALFNEIKELIKEDKLKSAQISLAVLSELLITRVNFPKVEKIKNHKLMLSEDKFTQFREELKKFYGNLEAELASSLVTLFIKTSELEKKYEDISTEYMPSRHGTVHQPLRYISDYNLYAILAVVLHIISYNNQRVNHK